MPAPEPFIAFHVPEGEALSRIVDDVVNDIRGALELWPTLVKICYFRKHRRQLPQTRVRNVKRQ